MERARKGGKEGYLGGAPDPGCEFTASTSPKNTRVCSKIRAGTGSFWGGICFEINSKVRKYQKKWTKMVKKKRLNPAKMGEG